MTQRLTDSKGRVKTALTRNELANLQGNDLITFSLSRSRTSHWLILHLNCISKLLNYYISSTRININKSLLIKEY